MAEHLKFHTMHSTASTEAFSLVPEEFLLEKVSPIWQQRFERALEIIFQHIEQPISWNQIACEAAISPHHFHRMFLAVFSETPGQYTRRLRIGLAFEKLLEDENQSITDIALSSGFSSSQALAKAMKRDIGYSPSQVRALVTEDQDELERLIYLLSYPQKAIPENMEDQLAAAIPFEVIGFDTRYFKMEIKTNASEKQLKNSWEKLKQYPQQDLAIITANSELERPIYKITSSIGVECDKDQANTILPAADFLCCRVRISTEGGYLAAWDALYKYLLSQGLEPNDQGVTLDVIHNPAQLGDEICEMTLALELSKH
ncbi:hypothetical protein R50073_32670 [Maricurvus nonylphenolicus]|uniref:helix-turn-helix domain-containing protein n=1 Tax=Maricurvus nonylphenolicus TaxID=1008307 RepID=UPI0036F3ECD3